MKWVTFRQLPQSNTGYSIEVKLEDSGKDGGATIVIANSDIALSWGKLNTTHFTAEVNSDNFFTEKPIVQTNPNEKYSLRLDIPASPKNPVRFIKNGKLITQTFLKQHIDQPLTLYLLRRDVEGQSTINSVVVKNYEIKNFNK